ncbi:hypothetical protein HYQ46_013450 [Verticillium longisporum]|nr:hypothetical protein HYQ46_013450 [Verticillium longisporum]
MFAPDVLALDETGYVSANQLKDYAKSQIGWILSTVVFLYFFCSIYIGSSASTQAYGANKRYSFIDDSDKC